MFVLFVFSFLAGLCTMLSPCILPILPIVLAAGASKGRLRPLGVCIGLVISFTFFTIALTSIVKASGISPDLLRYIAIGLVFVFGLCMVVPPLSRWLYSLLSPIAEIGERLQHKGPKEGLIGGLTLGVALGLLWTPCAGPILAAITTFIATQSITFVTVGLALAYVIGAAIPLFLIAWGGGKVIGASKLLSAHTEGVRMFFGGVTVLVAVAIAFHWDMLIEQKVALFVPSIQVEDNPKVLETIGTLQNEIRSSAQQEVPREAPAVHPVSYGKAPELTGATNWIHSPPLTLEQMKGKVVLIDFWTYTCINCLRTLPYIKDLYAKYKDDGLVVIGIHTPEFEFEKEPSNVSEAVSRLGITYPVAQDNNYTVWQAFHNRYWPAHYLIDQNGNIVFIHFGEGGYAEMERQVRELLHLPPLTIKESAVQGRPISSETYLGTSRGRSYTHENAIAFERTKLYTYFQPLNDDEVGLKGSWNVQGERITAEGNDCYLEYNFLGNQAYLVLSGSSSEPILVFLDGKLVGEVRMDGDRKYDLVDTTYGRHLLSLKVSQGISAYAFTFGNEQLSASSSHEP